MRLAIILMAMALSACTDQCKEQGGHWVQEGFYYVWVITDAQKGIGYPQAHPNFICKKENQ
jgi:hypothetical protein